MLEKKVASNLTFDNIKEFVELTDINEIITETNKEIFLKSLDIKEIGLDVLHLMFAVYRGFLLSFYKN
jgi:hypothetical protein